MPASFDALLKASFCASFQSVGTVITAALIVLPMKSDAEDARRRMCLVVISDTVTDLGVSESASCIEKATVESCFCGWADAWHGVGSIAEKLLPR